MTIDRPSPFRSRAPRLPWTATLALALLATGLPAQAGVGLWTPVGPEGGTVSALAVSPADPRVVLAGTSSGGVFRSGDGGVTWAPANAGLGGFGNRGGYPPASTLEADPRNPLVAYLGTQFNGVFHSGDGGRSWTRCGPLPPFGLDTHVGDLVADSRLANVVYAATPQGVLRSANGCRTWVRRSNRLPPGLVLALGQDPAGTYLYAGLHNGGVYRSADQGLRWERANAGVPAQVRTLGFDPTSPAVVFAGTASGLYRSANRGGSWTRVGAGLIDRIVVGTGFLEASGQAFTATRDRVFRSLDRGLTWSPVESPPVPQLLSFALGSEAIYVSSTEDRRGGGVARSTDGGESWEVVNRGLSTLRPLELAFHPADPATLYLAAGAIGLYRSSDRGETWKHLLIEPNDTLVSIESVAVDPARPQTVYAGSSTTLGLLRSDDAGATWRSASPAGNTAMTVIRPDPRTLGGLWAGGFGTTFHTPDGGTTWEHITLAEGLLPWIQDIEVDPADPNVVTYAGSRPFGARGPSFKPILFRTEDGGASWLPIDTTPLPGSAVVDVESDLQSPGSFYAATTTGLYRTDDRGVTWRPLLDFGIQTGDVVATADAVYASRGASVLRSTDRGETWTPIRNGLGARLVERLWADPHDPRHLFAGTSASGLYEYTLPPAP